MAFLLAPKGMAATAYNNNTLIYTVIVTNMAFAEKAE